MPARLPRPRISLSVLRPRGSTAVEVERRPLCPWWLAVLLGALLAAGVGWLISTGLVVAGWLSAMNGSLGEAVLAGTRVWLLAHGARVTVGPVSITLVPLGASLALAALLAWAATFAGRQASLARTPKVAAHQAGRLALTVGGATAAVYTVLLTAVAMVVLGPGPAARVLVLTGLVSLLACVWGASEGTRWRPTRSWPRWARAIPRAVGAALAVMVACGAAVVVVAMVQHLPRMARLQDALGGGVVAALVLGLVQAGYAPNFALWGSSWALGPGFSLGRDSLVSMADTHLGLLPGLPVLGAVPDPGPGRGYLALWLASGVLAGAAAGWVVVRSRRRARFDETALVGGLSGVLAGLVLVAVCALSGGDLGSARLAGIGPRLDALAVLAPSILGLAGLGSGLLLGLLRPPLPEGQDPELAEETRLLPRR